MEEKSIDFQKKTKNKRIVKPSNTVYAKGSSSEVSRFSVFSLSTRNSFEKNRNGLLFCVVKLQSKYIIASMEGIANA